MTAENSIGAKMRWARRTNVPQLITTMQDLHKRLTLAVGAQYFINANHYYIISEQLRDMGTKLESLKIMIETMQKQQKRGGAE